MMEDIRSARLVSQNTFDRCARKAIQLMLKLGTPGMPACRLGRTGGVPELFNTAALC